MPAPLPAVLIALDLDDARATRKQLEEHHKEPRRISKVWTMTAWTENQTVGVPFDYHLPAGSTAYVSATIQRASGDLGGDRVARFLSTVQSDTNGLKVRNLNREGYWTGWDAEPAPPTAAEQAAVLAAAEEIRAQVDAMESRTSATGGINATHVAIEQTLRTRAGLPSYVAELDGPGKFLPPAEDSADAASWTAGEQKEIEKQDAPPLPEQEPAHDVVPDLVHQEPEQPELEDGVSADGSVYDPDVVWQDRVHASGCPLDRDHAGPCPPPAPDEGEKEEGTTDDDSELEGEKEEPRSDLKVAAAGPSPSEVCTWIYVAGSGWWDGPWLIQNGQATDDVGTKVDLRHVRATSTVPFDQRRQLPGSLR